MKLIDGGSLDIETTDRTYITDGGHLDCTLPNGGRIIWS